MLRRDLVFCPDCRTTNCASDGWMDCANIIFTDDGVYLVLGREHRCKEATCPRTTFSNLHPSVLQRLPCYLQNQMPSIFTERRGIEK
jgi:hypothetical protein